MDRRGSGGMVGMGPRRMYMGDGYGPGPRDREMGMGPPDRGMGMGMGMPRNFGRAPMGPPGMMGIGRDFGPQAGGPPPRQEPEFVVDREKTCPLLLRVWIKHGGHHKQEEFEVRGKEPAGDIQIYTWMDANLRELSDLIKEVNPDARNRGSRLSFALIYPDRSGNNVMRKLGQVHCSRVSEDDNRTLKSLKFQTGDFLDVAVLAGF